jgi:sulfur transfer protein SufE
LQVEVKDATVKTFAEIMAEKKRKRQLAQQGKSFTPLPEEDIGNYILYNSISSSAQFVY